MKCNNFSNMKCSKMYLEKFGKMFQVAPNGKFE